VVQLYTGYNGKGHDRMVQSQGKGDLPSRKPSEQDILFDTDAVGLMLGRSPRGEVFVARRCHFGLPVVIRVPPVLPDGVPFPTLYWLTCPLAVKRVSALESEGLVKALEGLVDTGEADVAYATERENLLVQMREMGDLVGAEYFPVGGVGGAHGGVKCLHARYGYWLVGGEDPAGARVAEFVGFLDCERPCLPDDLTSADVEITRKGRGVWPKSQNGSDLRSPVSVRRGGVFSSLVRASPLHAQERIGHVEEGAGDPSHAQEEE